jgi:hypothetical protein
MDCSLRRRQAAFCLLFSPIEPEEDERLLFSPTESERRRQDAFFSNRTGYVASGLALEGLEGLHQEVLQVLKIIKL